MDVRTRLILGGIALALIVIVPFRQAGAPSDWRLPVAEEDFGTCMEERGYPLSNVQVSSEPGSGVLDALVYDPGLHLVGEPAMLANADACMTEMLAIHGLTAQPDD